MDESILCNGKSCYDKKTALTKKNFLGRKGKKLRVYLCPLCSHWHLTNDEKNKSKNKPFKFVKKLRVHEKN